MALLTSGPGMTGARSRGHAATPSPGPELDDDLTLDEPRRCAGGGVGGAGAKSQHGGGSEHAGYERGNGQHLAPRMEQAKGIHVVRRMMSKSRTGTGIRSVGGTSSIATRT